MIKNMSVYPNSIKEKSVFYTDIKLDLVKDKTGLCKEIKELKQFPFINIDIDSYCGSAKILSE